MIVHELPCAEGIEYLARLPSFVSVNRGPLYSRGDDLRLIAMPPSHPVFADGVKQMRRLVQLQPERQHYN